MKSLLSLAAVCLIVAGTSGCAGLSFQTYGSPLRGHRITEGATRADVLANLGEPDSIYRAKDTEVFIYKGYKGANYLGIFSTIQRTDKVVVMDQGGAVLTASDVDAGKGLTIFSPAFLDATHPVRTTELTEKPENFDYEFKVGETPGN